MRTLVIISDLHCGSIFGLTPRGWQTDSPYHKSQKEAFDSYTNIVHKWTKPDILIFNGDAIDGKQVKSGGAELLTTDRNVQAEIAEYCISMWKAKKIFMSYGTSYHTGESEDFEYNIAKNLGATIEGRLLLNIEGLTIDARHKVSSSSIYHGKATPLLKEVMWTMLKEASQGWPKVDILIRSHVHYHLWIEEPGKVAFTTPALQLARGRYGSRQMSGITHWGAIKLTLDKGKIVGRDIICQRLHANKPKIYRIK